MGVLTFFLYRAPPPFMESDAGIPEPPKRGLRRPGRGEHPPRADRMAAVR